MNYILHYSNTIFSATLAYCVNNFESHVLNCHERIANCGLKYG